MSWPCVGIGLGEEGGNAVAEALKVNKTLLRLNLRSKHRDMHCGCGVVRRGAEEHDQRCATRARGVCMGAAGVVISVGGKAGATLQCEVYVARACGTGGGGWTVRQGCGEGRCTGWMMCRSCSEGACMLACCMAKRRVCAGVWSQWCVHQWCGMMWECGGEGQAEWGLWGLGAGGVRRCGSQCGCMGAQVPCR